MKRGFVCSVLLFDRVILATRGFGPPLHIILVFTLYVIIADFELEEFFKNYLISVIIFFRIKYECLV